MIAATPFKALAQAQAADAASSGGAVVIDPKPLFEISPHLYMQFMEPLGVTDSSVEAAWDYNRDDWRKDFCGNDRRPAPGMMRFGGLFSRYLQMARRRRAGAEAAVDAQLRLGRQKKRIASDA